jgi:cysteine desulfuration protein SufE
VEGCASQVWLMQRVENGHLHFQGDSDALIVKGLVAIIIALFDGLTPDEVLAVDALGELARLGLDQHLSQQRSNGLRAMVQRIRQIAASQ